MGNTPVKGWRNRRGICLVMGVAVGAGAFALGGTSGADVTAVTGSASGVRGAIGLFGGAPVAKNPGPVVTLPPAGGGPMTTTVPTLSLEYGPAVFFRSGEATVSTQGATGPAGSVTSSTSFGPTAGTGNTPCLFAYPATFTAGSTTVTSATADFTAADVGRIVSTAFLPETPSPTRLQRIATIVTVNSPTSVTLSIAPTGSGTGYLTINRGVGSCIYNSAFVADTATSTCTANQAGITASTRFTNGFLVTETDQYQNPTVVVPVPDNPAPNTSISGFFILNASTTESFTYILNEQISNPDGSLTVNAAHLIAHGQTAIGEAWFGTATCGVTIPRVVPPADFNGDGRTDLSVFRPSTGAWYVNGGTNAFWGGEPGDIPVPGDYNGDAKIDFAIYRPSTGTWYVLGGTSAFWGTTGDIPVPGDYDGNGTTDIAVFRPSTGTWYVLGGISAFWGTTGDVPVPGDYDGNGTTDIAVFRPSTGTWYVLGGTSAFWGTTGDIPLPLPYAIQRTLPG